MNTARLLLALCASILTTCAAAREAQPRLGRLFLTPEWRTHLERQRQLNLQETRALEGGTMRLDGMVVRSSGKTTIWVNDRPQTENVRDSGVVAAPVRQQPGRATLVTGTEAPAELRVGETLNRATRETGGGFATGEIRVNRPPPKQ